MVITPEPQVVNKIGRGKNQNNWAKLA